MRLPFAFVALALALLVTGCGGGTAAKGDPLKGNGNAWKKLSQADKLTTANFCLSSSTTGTAKQLASGLDAFYRAPAAERVTIADACKQVLPKLGTKRGGIEQGVSAPDPDPRGSYRLTCDYLLGDDVDSYTLIGGGTVENVGNVEIQVRVKVKWEQLGAEPIRDEQTFDLRVGKRKRVSFNMPTTNDVIDRLQSAEETGRGCSISATIVDSSSPGSQGTMSVSQAAARLGPLCLDRAKGETVDQGEIDARANDLISAYEESGKDREDRDFMRVARDNMESGCGPQLVDDLQRAIDESR